MSIMCLTVLQGPWASVCRNIEIYILACTRNLNVFGNGVEDSKETVDIQSTAKVRFYNICDFVRMLVMTVSQITFWK